MPQPVLAAVVIAASISLFDVAELRRLYRVRKTEFALAVACALGVAFVGVLAGHRHRRRPVGRSTSSSAPGRRTRRCSGRRRTSPATTTSGAIRMRSRIPGLLIVRWSAPLFFANANQFRDRIRELVKAADPPPQWVLVAAEPITDIDTTAGAMLARPRPRAERGGDPPRVRRAPVGRPRHDRAVRPARDHRGRPFLPIGHRGRRRIAERHEPAPVMPTSALADDVADRSWSHAAPHTDPKPAGERWPGAYPSDGGAPLLTSQSGPLTRPPSRAS